VTRAAYRTLAVDDERPARAKVARLLAADPRFVLAGEAADGIEALRTIETLRPDVVVLDVQMPGITGFEVLDALGPDREFAVIFSTAFEQHALRAFDAHAVDYLLKPYDAERFQRALDKAWAQLVAGHRDARADVTALVQSAVAPADRERIVVRTAAGWVPLRLDAITRIEAADKHVTICTGTERHVVRESLGALLARLDPRRFVRVHRSEVVHIDAVARLEPWTHGDGLLVMRDGAAVVLSRTYRKTFLERFEKE
jgi:two-component system LytT family response regulator